MTISPAPRLGKTLAATMQARLQAVTRFLRWTCQWEVEPGLVRQEGCRIWLRREACGVFWDEVLFLIEVIPDRAVGDLTRSKAAAAARGAIHCILTENDLSETMAANLRLMASACYDPPNDDMVDTILDLELPLGRSMTLGVLEARLARRAFPRQQIRPNILRLIEEGYLSINLVTPITSGTEVFHLPADRSPRLFRTPWDECMGRSATGGTNYSAALSALAVS